MQYDTRIVIYAVNVEKLNVVEIIFKNFLQHAYSHLKAWFHVNIILKNFSVLFNM